MASQNAVSIEASSASRAARNTPLEPMQFGTRTQIFRQVLAPPGLPQGLRRSGRQDAEFPPLMRANTARSASIPLSASPPRSARCLPRCRRKCSVPGRREPLLQPAKTQKSEALTVQSIRSARSTSAGFRPNWPEKTGKMQFRLRRAYRFSSFARR
jgi:hypothetical protein